MSLELAGLFVTSGKVSPSVIDDALRRQVLAGGSFDTALLEAGAAIREADCLRFLERASALPGIDGPHLFEADPGAAALLPAKLAERHCLLPLRGEGKLLHVAVPFPISKTMLEEIGFLLGRELEGLGLARGPAARGHRPRLPDPAGAPVRDPGGDAGADARPGHVLTRPWSCPRR
ncbi:MAG: hypothetical protein QM765_50035 [Myxococcales bacterium]